MDTRDSQTLGQQQLEDDGFVRPKSHLKRDRKKDIRQRKLAVKLASPAAKQVLETTELVEMILLDISIPTHTLFALKRVNKRFKAMIEGSKKLQAMMFLEYSSENMTPEEFEGKSSLEVAALFNPLLGINPMPLDATTPLTMFKHFNFGIRDENDQRCCGVILICDRPYNRVEYNLSSYEDGSWEKTKIARIPLELEFLHTGQARLFGDREVFVADKDTSMGELVEALGEWYRGLFQSKRSRYRDRSDNIMRLVANVRAV